MLILITLLTGCFSEQKLTEKSAIDTVLDKVPKCGNNLETFNKVIESKESEVNVSNVSMLSEYIAVLNGKVDSMELIFIRHAQGEHTINLPKSLDISHPGLTEIGKQQTRLLADQFTLKSEDIVIASPTRRTIETANIFIDSLEVRKYISPLIGPRMFPQNSKWITLECDEIYSSDDIEQLYRGFEVVDLNEDLWTEGINTINERLFKELVERFIDWIKTFKSTVYLISHDGTINNYRQILEERDLTRSDFLREAGWHKVIL